MRYLYIIALLLLTVSCQKEIDLDYHEVDPVVCIEGRVTNEGIYVLITHTRSMDDSVKVRGIRGAVVTITADDGRTEQLEYDARSGYYRSPSDWKGVPQQTYHLNVLLDGQQYEAVSTMPMPAPVTSAKFVWQSVLKNRLLVLTVWATDPEPDVRNYYWYRVNRQSVDTTARRKYGADPYRWNVFDDRGSMGGRIYRDIHCMMELEDDEEPEDEDDYRRSLLFDGDTITFQLMTIDRPTFDYYQSLTVGQRMGANPRSNITGGCLGYFVAGCVTRSDTLYYRKESIQE